MGFRRISPVAAQRSARCHAPAIVTTLCRELERIERAALADLHRPPEADPDCDAYPSIPSRADTVGGALVVTTPGVDSLLLNRVIGLGAVANRGIVANVLDRFGKAGVERYFVHLGPEPGDRDVRDWLAERGVVRYPRSWDKLVRGRAAPRPARSNLRVRIADAQDRPVVAALVAQGFDLPAAGGALYARTIGRPGWEVFVATDPHDERHPVAVGGLYHHNAEAYLAFAATDPQHRRRGAQAALMEARIRCALDLGCERMVTETGQAVAGEANSSHNNMRRAGFQVVCARENFAPRGTTWTGR